jgi:hypothetical protein
VPLPGHPHGTGDTPRRGTGWRTRTDLRAIGFRSSGPAREQRHLGRGGVVVRERERRHLVARAALPPRGDRRVERLGQEGREEALLGLGDALDVEARALAQARDVRLRRGGHGAVQGGARALEVQLEDRLAVLDEVQEGVVRRVGAGLGQRLSTQHLLATDPSLHGSLAAESVVAAPGRIALLGLWREQNLRPLAWLYVDRAVVQTAGVCSEWLTQCHEVLPRGNA